MNSEIPWYNYAIVGGIIAAGVTAIVNCLIALIRTRTERENAARKAKADWHLQRRQYLLDLMEAIVSIRFLMNDFRQQKDFATILKTEFSDRINEEVHDRMEQWIVKAEVSAELYGAFPENTKAPDRRLMPFVDHLVAQHTRGAIFSPNILEIQFRNLNHHMMHMIHEIKRLIVSEELLAKDALQKTNKFSPPELKYFNRYIFNEKFKLVPVENLDMSIVNDFKTPLIEPDNMTTTQYYQWHLERYANDKRKNNAGN